jgi:hypothetical protein
LLPIFYHARGQIVFMISRAVVLICLIHIRKTTLHRSFGGNLAAVGFIR